MKMVTKNRDAVRAAWDEHTRALYATLRQTREEEMFAEDAFREAQTRLRQAKKKNKAADAAFGCTEGGRQFWAAVRADIAEEDAAAKSSVP